MSRSPKIVLIRDLDTAKVPLSSCVASIGNFDGFHIGHRQLIEKVVDKANALHLLPTLITFEPLPQSFFKKAMPSIRLTSLRQKLNLLMQWGIKQVVCLRFNATLANLSASDFIEKYLIKGLNVHYLIVGEDFRFGYQKGGDVTFLKKVASQYGVVIDALTLMEKNNQKISSSIIREYLIKGDLATANALLGRPYSLSAKVIRGAKLGRQLGFPTANIPMKGAKDVFKGVFLTQVVIENQQYNAVTNVGTRPTVDGKHYLVETHVLDFIGNLYGKRLEITFLQKIRDEKRFANIEMLKSQIQEDIQNARMIIAKGLECEQYDRYGL